MNFSLVPTSGSRELGLARVPPIPAIYKKQCVLHSIDNAVQSAELQYFRLAITCTESCTARLSSNRSSKLSFARIRSAGGCSGALWTSGAAVRASSECDELWRWTLSSSGRDPLSLSIPLSWSGAQFPSGVPSLSMISLFSATIFDTHIKEDGNWKQVRVKYEKLFNYGIFSKEVAPFPQYSLQSRVLAATNTSQVSRWPPEITQRWKNIISKYANS